jgi:large subunit ribosomal protein L21
MYAVIRTGGKQYRVAANDIIEIERLGAEAGEVVAFRDVLMVANGDAVEIGAPLVAGATVAGEVQALTRGPKVIIFKKRRRKHYRRKNGHRQDLMTVKITEILTGGKEPVLTAKAAEPAPAAATESEAAKPARKPRAKKADAEPAASE